MAEVKNITPLEAKELGSKIIDVRTAAEFSSLGHAPGAINIPWLLELDPNVPNPDFVEQFSSEFGDKSADLILTCQRGRRGANAVLALQAVGYEKLLNIETGMGGWTESNLPLEK